MPSILVKVILALLLVVSLTGCAFEAQIAGDPVKYNKSAAKARNEVLLLNIVRAAYRHPMQFTALSQIRGNISGSIDSSLSVPFGGDADSKYDGKVSGAFKSNPSFDVAILDSKKFMSGILSEVDLSLVEYYWAHGWPKELLAYLFVERIEQLVKEVDERGEPIYRVTEVYDNDPGEPDRQHKGGNEDEQKGPASFENLIKWLDLNANSRRLSLLRVVVPKDVGPPLDENEAKQHLSTLIEARKAKLGVVEEKGRFQITRISDTVMVRLSIPDLKTYDRKKFEVKVEDAWEPKSVRATVSSQAVQITPTERAQTENWRIVIRSPHGILYYLGELARRQVVAGKGPPWLPMAGKAPLFVIKRGEPSVPALVEVEYRGTNYYIPDGGDGKRSMQCLALVAQLLALHQERDEMPRTNVVTTTGG